MTMMTIDIIYRHSMTFSGDYLDDKKWNFRKIEKKSKSL
jgi:hypothetical protein